MLFHLAKVPLKVFSTLLKVHSAHCDNMIKTFFTTYYDLILFQGSLEEIVEKHDVSFNASLFMKVLNTVKP